MSSLQYQWTRSTKVICNGQEAKRIDLDYGCYAHLKLQQPSRITKNLTPLARIESGENGNLFIDYSEDISNLLYNSHLFLGNIGVNGPEQQEIYCFNLKCLAQANDFVFTVVEPARNYIYMDAHGVLEVVLLYHNYHQQSLHVFDYASCKNAQEGIDLVYIHDSKLTVGQEHFSFDYLGRQQYSPAVIRDDKNPFYLKRVFVSRDEFNEQKKCGIEWVQHHYWFYIDLKKKKWLRKRKKNIFLGEINFKIAVGNIDLRHELFVYGNFSNFSKTQYNHTLRVLDTGKAVNIPERVDTVWPGMSVMASKPKKQSKKKRIKICDVSISLDKKPFDDMVAISIPVFDERYNKKLKKKRRKKRKRMVKNKKRKTKSKKRKAKRMRIIKKVKIK